MTEISRPLITASEEENAERLISSLESAIKRHGERAAIMQALEAGWPSVSIMAALTCLGQQR